MELYIVRRPFRSNGKQYLVGDLIEDPTQIRYFKTKIYDGQVLRLDPKDKNFKSIVKYFETVLNKPMEQNILAKFNTVKAKVKAKPKAKSKATPVKKPAKAKR